LGYGVLLMIDKDIIEEKYFLLEFDHTFLAASLKEEALLFGVKYPELFLPDVILKFQSFKSDFNIDHPLDHLSGGENSILAVIFYSALARFKNKPLEFLLYNILESLSASNRKILKDILIDFKKHNISYYVWRDNDLVDIYA